MRRLFDNLQICRVCWVGVCFCITFYILNVGTRFLHEFSTYTVDTFGVVGTL